MAAVANPSMNPSKSGAVFLSYAREDADAARRISDALRALGVEVWFDQNELRGGDAWDAKIRRQIKECALFVAVISQHSDERQEGYFRLEWELAAERTHLMVRGLPFILPVVIDYTKEADAFVPDRFREVQWTRLPGALATPHFVDQVKRLLEPSRQRRSVRLPESETETLTQTAQAKPRRKRWAGATVGFALLVAVGLVFFGSTRSSSPKKLSNAIVEAKGAAMGPAGATAASEKSIAVLPFANMSSDSENAFFADGVHEDVLTHLAKIRDLKVISRTSVLAYRDTAQRNLKKIASDLGVVTVLEGSVRRAGNTVRVTVQLIDARTDKHLWAETYDRDLTDIFVVQSAVAKAIAAALQVHLTPEERLQVAAQPTTNIEAYDLYLRARQLIRSFDLLPGR